jgi:ATP-dependent Clp protease ATP-binding subunit ClpA
LFERFTERARQVVVLAQDEARALKHNYIGTEHILLGLLREEEGVAARVLEGFDVTADEVRAQVRQIVGEGDEPATGQIPFTPRAKKVLELALREAMTLGHNYIGTEHVLLGIARENEGVAARILLDFDADAETIRNEIIRMLSGPRAAGVDPRVYKLLERIRARKREALAAGQVERAAQLRDREGWLLALAAGRGRPVSTDPAPPLPAPPRPLSASLFVGWLLFGISLGLGILIGWAIWGL